MKENTDNNKIVENDDKREAFIFKYSFINVPWDDRSTESKVGIVVLLAAIFTATSACVINNIVMHFREFGSDKNVSNSAINCYKVKFDDYRYVARIHSASSKELLCVGAVVSSTSILANGVCAKSGPIRVYFGSPTHPQCKKGFAVDVKELVFHDGIVSKKLALLSSFDDIERCSRPIRIGYKLDWKSRVYIVGRPLDMGRSFSRQHVTLTEKDSVPPGYSIKHLNIENMICVTDLARCPVRAGDLLVQNGNLFGLAATSVYRTDQNNIACFADLNAVRRELNELDAEIGY